MEETGRVQLAPEELASLARTKIVHVSCLTIAGIAVIVMCRALPSVGFPLGMFVTCSTFMVGGIIERVGRAEEGDASNSIVKHGCKTFRSWILGLFGVLYLYASAADN